MAVIGGGRQGGLCLGLLTSGRLEDAHRQGKPATVMTPLTRKGDMLLAASSGAVGIP